MSLQSLFYYAPVRGKGAATTPDVRTGRSTLGSAAIRWSGLISASGAIDVTPPETGDWVTPPETGDWEKFCLIPYLRWGSSYSQGRLQISVLYLGFENRYN